MHGAVGGHERMRLPASLGPRSPSSTKQSDERQLYLMRSIGAQGSSSSLNANRMKRQSLRSLRRRTHWSCAVQAFFAHWVSMHCSSA